MRCPACRLRRTRTSSRDRAISRGFTLIEIVIVILVILILLTLTLVVVGNTLDGDRVRGAARQVQNYLAGARDRAIYAASRQETDTAIPPAVGVRFFADPAFRLDDPSLPGGNRWRAFGSMVFVQENPPLQTWLQVAENTGVGRWEASQMGIDPDGAGPEKAEPIESLAIRSVRALIDRGLLDSHYETVNPISNTAGITRVYVLPVYFDDDQAQEPYFVKIVDAPVASGGSMGGPGGAWLQLGVLSKPFVQGPSYAEACRFRLLPSPMPSEEPRILPRNAVIDVESSFVSGTVLWRLLRIDGSFDVMFNARGVVEGPLAAAGVVNLTLADGRDVEQGFRLLKEVPTPGGFATLVPGSPFLDLNSDMTWDDADGDGKYDERQGEVFIISIRTQTGSAMAADLNPVTNAAGNFVDPFKYAEIGGEAK